MAKPQRGVRRHAALAVDDSGDPVHRNADLARDFRGRDTEFPELFGELLPTGPLVRGAPPEIAVSGPFSAPRLWR
jgi:hypothetical protein